MLAMTKPPLVIFKALAEVSKNNANLQKHCLDISLTLNMTIMAQYVSNSVIASRLLVGVAIINKNNGLPRLDFVKSRNDCIAEFVYFSLGLPSKSCDLLAMTMGVFLRKSKSLLKRV